MVNMNPVLIVIYSMIIGFACMTILYFYKGVYKILKKET